MKKIFFSIAVLLVFQNCKNDDPKRQIIAQEVSNAVESYRSKRLADCRTVALDSANKIADSIIIVRNTRVDPSLFIGKPLKPTKPLIKSPLDTTPVVPIINH